MVQDLFESEEEREAKKIQKYKEFLIEKGFRVEDPPKALKFNITRLDDLINFFYSRMSLKNPKLKQIKRNLGRDRKIASEFVKSRMEKGINRQRAYSEAAELIDILFKYEDRFKFKYPVESIGILGQKNLRWVTEKLENMWLREKIYEKSKNLREFNQRLEKAQKVETELEQLDRAEELEQILKEMDGHYGEEEER
jgi:hypothetical protein